MKDKTDKFSFIVKPSTVQGAGVGVFALHDIAEGTYLEVFLPDFEEEILDESQVPAELQGYCITQENGKLLCPKYFNRMDIGNYLNHSKNANTIYKKDEGYYASRDIKAGEEIFADYRDLAKQLGEPEESFEDYMK